MSRKVKSRRTLVQKTSKLIYPQKTRKGIAPNFDMPKYEMRIETTAQ